MTLAPWFERVPERLEYELQALAASGIRYEVDEQARNAGILRLRLFPEFSGEVVELEAIFPDLYPYFRFTIKAPKWDLPHHQHPFGKDLCLIGRDTANWETRDTLARFVTERVPLVARAANASAEEIHRIETVEGEPVEQHQAEPFSDFYGYYGESSVLVDGAWEIPPEVERGVLQLGYDGKDIEQLRGAVLEVRDGNGTVLARGEPAWQARFRRTIEAPWIRSSEPVRVNDPHAFYRELAARDPRVDRQVRHPLDSKGHFNVAAVVFPEEHGWRASATGWAFGIAVGGKNVRSAFRSFYRARPLRAGRSDMAARVPELCPLSNKSIAVFGLGSLGAPSALEFARAGTAEVRLLDFDFLEPGTTVRWPLGFPAWGRSKVALIEEQIRSHYPHVAVLRRLLRVGMVRENPTEPSDATIVGEMLDGVSLVFDATAELGIQHLLSDLCRERGIPYVAVSATQGAWGGIAARIVPGTTGGCWFCMQSALGTTVPLPPADATGTVQPRGCADPTFTGTGFDLATIALAGVRLALSTLCSAEGGYPDQTGDVQVLTIRDPETGLIAPRWQTFAIPRSAECPICNPGQ